VVATTREEAEAAARRLLTEGGTSVVIEEFLDGEEVSFFVLCDGKRAVPLLAAQDHKRAHDGDQGPNTGGMGACAPAPVFTPAIEAATMADIIAPTLAAMAEAGTPFVGVLFAGLMLTAGGPKLIEYNVRLGDPECQALMMLLDEDLAELLLAAAEGRLGDRRIRWRDGAAATVVMAARGYPGAPAAGGAITGIAQA
jgi:phosphoribosylamine--glycine ligase